MSPDNYTPEQRKDIEARVAEAKEFLKGIKLQPAVFMTAVNTGNDCFSMRPLAYLQDQKYQAQPSPIQKENL